MSQMQLIKSRSGSGIIPVLIVAIVALSIFSGLYALLGGEVQREVFYKENLKFKTFLSSFKATLANPHMCYQIFCPNKPNCPQLFISDTPAYLNIEKFLPGHKVSNKITVSKIYLDSIRRSGEVHSVSLGNISVYPDPLRSESKQQVSRLFGFLKVEALFKSESQTKRMTNDIPTVKTELPMYFHTDSNSQIKGCYVATPESQAFLCEQQSHRVWSFETTASHLKCQPANDCIVKKQDASGNCNLPYEKSSKGIAPGSYFYSVIDDIPFFKMCLWCGD